MKFQFLPENFSRSENAPPFETRKIRHFEVERIFLENKKMVDHFYFNFLIFRNLLIASVFRQLLRFGTQSVPQGAENGCFRQKPCVPKR